MILQVSHWTIWPVFIWQRRLGVGFVVISAVNMSEIVVTAVAILTQTISRPTWVLTTLSACPTALSSAWYAIKSPVTRATCDNTLYLHMSDNYCFVKCVSLKTMLNRFILYKLFQTHLKCSGSLEELARLYLSRTCSGSYQCGMCGKELRDKHNAKTHLECKHFPTQGGYTCNFCGKTMNTKNALNCHAKSCGKIFISWWFYEVWFKW